MRRKRSERYLFQKTGFIQTLQIFDVANALEMPLREFYEALNEKSYYNAFFRVQKEMIEQGLIRIVRHKRGKDKRKYIVITAKGIKTKKILKELIDLTTGE